MQTPVVSTKIKDDWGVEHEYVMHRFGAVQGLRIGTELLGLLGETLNFHGGQVGPAIKGLALGIMQRGNDRFVGELLEHVRRDGKPINDVAALESAYAGNLGELLRAVDWSIGENFAGFSSAALDVIGGRLANWMTALADESSASPLRQWLTTAFGASLSQDSAAGPSSATRGPSTSSSRPTNTSRTARR